MRQDLGKTKFKPKFKDLLSKSRAINQLSAARLFLFGARDVWFVVALPLYLASQAGWSQSQIGSFLALWIIGYGVVQALAPKITGWLKHPSNSAAASSSTGISTGSGDAQSALFRWALLLCLLPLTISIGMHLSAEPVTVLLIGLGLFGAVFAVNSSLHSYLIVQLAREDGVSLDVGFYYMANAMGRLIGTLLSGWVYQSMGLAACLLISSGFLLLTAVISAQLRSPRNNSSNSNSADTTQPP